MGDSVAEDEPIVVAPWPGMRTSRACYQSGPGGLKWLKTGPLLHELFVFHIAMERQFVGVFQPTHDVDDLLLGLLNRRQTHRP